MYAWLWRALPGPTWCKVLEAVALAVAVVALLFLVVFPWLAPRLPFPDVTVGAAIPAQGHLASHRAT